MPYKRQEGVNHMFSTITIVTFSPTGGTRKAAVFLAKGLARQIREADLSLPEAQPLNFTREDLILFAGPVYGGRIPSCMAEKLKNIRGNQTPAVVAAVYGNRAYEDALLELHDIVLEQGFKPIAAAALLAEHSIIHKLAAHRPDVQDQACLAEFSKRILMKWESGQRDITSAIPGSRPYKVWNSVPKIPVVSDACSRCGLCAQKCPVQAISKVSPGDPDPQKCIQCMRCVSICPAHARSLPAQVLAALGEHLQPFAGLRRDNALYL